MKLQAKAGCYLTQKEDVSIEQRHFVTTVSVEKSTDIDKWVEVSEAEKEKMLQKGTIFDVEQLSADYLNKIETVLAEIPAHINEKYIAPTDALAHQDYYPVWGDENAPMGKEVEAGFRFRYRLSEDEPYTLYEVVTPHTLSADNPPTLPIMLLSATADADVAEEPATEEGSGMTELTVTEEPIVYFMPVSAEIQEENDESEITNE